jgi:hypothetical protein
MDCDIIHMISYTYDTYDIIYDIDYDLNYDVIGQTYDIAVCIVAVLSQ